MICGTKYNKKAAIMPHFLLLGGRTVADSWLLNFIADEKIVWAVDKGVDQLYRLKILPQKLIAPILDLSFIDEDKKVTERPKSVHNRRSVSYFSKEK